MNTSDPVNRLEEDIAEAMSMPRAIPFKREAGRDRNRPVEEATDPNTDRTTTNMMEEMMHISEKLEIAIKDASAVRDTVSLRINDLNKALAANKAAMEVLTKK